MSIKKLVFTTQYLDVYSEYVQEGSVQSVYELDVDLIITLDNLVTASYFDIEMYERFNNPSTDSKLTFIICKKINLTFEKQWASPVFEKFIISNTKL